MLDLEPIKAREKAATEGPWSHRDGAWDICKTGVISWVGSDEIPSDPAHDAEFIAYARTDIPALVAEVEALRTALIKFANISASLIKNDFKMITDALSDWGLSLEDLSEMEP